jgi:Mrp family chromosome partitioning ATPase
MTQGPKGITMRKYNDALNRAWTDTDEFEPSIPLPITVGSKTEQLTRRSHVGAPSTEVFSDGLTMAEVPVVGQPPGLLATQTLLVSMARQQAIHRLCECIAPAALVEKSWRIAVSGCRPRDGASSVAAALAFDLSQRLSVPTLLVDANLRAPGLERVIDIEERRMTSALPNGAVEISATVWPRLTLAICSVDERDVACERLMAALEPVLGSFAAVVIDLGVARLDSRLLPLVRPADAIMLVARYGQTHRQELVTTVAALRSANRTVAGLIFNAQPSLRYPSFGENSSHE